MKRLSLVCWILLVVGGAASLAACGQKGPLYLPDTPSRQQGK